MTTALTRVAVVTGGASGIGEATARLLVQRGVGQSDLVTPWYV